MRLIAGPRQSGKTWKAIELANERDAYLAVHNKERASQVYHSDTYPDLDRFPITFRELRDYTGYGQQQAVVIDDLDQFLSDVLPHEVELMGAAATVEAAEVLDEL